MTRKGRLSPIDFARCGTAANCRQHYRLGEKPCEACAKANARAKADCVARKKKERAAS